MSGAKVETFIDALVEDEARVMASRKCIVDPVFDRVADDGGPLIYGCDPPPVGYRNARGNESSARPLSSASQPSETSPQRAAPIATAVALPVERPAYGRWALAISTVAIVALSSVVLLLALRKPSPTSVVMIPAPAVGPPARAAFAPTAIAACPSRTTLPISVYDIVEAWKPAPTFERVRGDGETYDVATWSARGGAAAYKLTSLGNKFGPRYASLLVATSTAQLIADPADTLADFLADATDTLDTAGWRKWMTLSPDAWKPMGASVETNGCLVLYQIERRAGGIVADVSVWPSD